jgi:hypothetical protein
MWQTDFFYKQIFKKDKPDFLCNNSPLWKVGSVLAKDVTSRVKRDGVE